MDRKAHTVIFQTIFHFRYSIAPLFERKVLLELWNQVIILNISGKNTYIRICTITILNYCAVRTEGKTLGNVYCIPNKLDQHHPSCRHYIPRDILFIGVPEVLEYARWLGIQENEEDDLLWIAREGLTAPLPENWKPWYVNDAARCCFLSVY